MKQLVDKLNGISSSSNDTSTDSIESRWYYDNERILFFKDGFLEPEPIALAHKLGGLNEAVSKDDSGHTVSSQAWEYGTCEYYTSEHTMNGSITQICFVVTIKILR